MLKYKSGENILLPSKKNSKFSAGTSLHTYVHAYVPDPNNLLFRGPNNLLLYSLKKKNLLLYQPNECQCFYFSLPKKMNVNAFFFVW